ncbi:DUF1801 domain-containing protein [Chitinimonas naiadis]
MATSNPATLSADAELAAYLAALPSEDRRTDCIALIAMMREATGAPPRMWGTMVGFGDLHYRYDSGREGDTFLLGFASRKADLTLYLGCDLNLHADLLAPLGKIKMGKGCLYLRRLADVPHKHLLALLKTAASHNAATASPGAD